MQAHIKHDVTMELNLLLSDRLILVSCKFEMLTFEKALFIKHYVQFALLFVHTVFLSYIFIGPDKHNFNRKIVNTFLTISLNICFSVLTETVLVCTHNICLT